MEIGTTNISAMIGPYVVPLATATEKFGIPYFVTSPLEHHQYRPYNMISIAPDPMDIVFIATEVAKRYKWATVAVIYDSAEGETHICIHYRATMWVNTIRSTLNTLSIMYLTFHLY